MTLQNNTLNICFFHLLLKTAFSQRAHNKRHFQQNFILSLFLFHLISLSCYTPGSQFTREEPNLLAANQNTLLPYSAASDSAPDSLFCPKTTTDRNYALLPWLLSFPEAGINNPALPWFFFPFPTFFSVISSAPVITFHQESTSFVLTRTTESDQNKAGG